MKHRTTATAFALIVLLPGLAGIPSRGDKVVSTKAPEDLTCASSWKNPK